VTAAPDPISVVASWILPANSEGAVPADPILGLIAEPKAMVAQYADLRERLGEIENAVYDGPADKMVDEDQIIETPTITLAGLIAHLEFLRDANHGALCIEINVDTIVEGVRTVAVGALTGP
jgi:hypothetical protein